MKHTAQLIAYGHYGVPSPSARSFDVSAARAFLAATRRGRAVSLRLLGDVSAQGSGSDIDALGVVPSFEFVSPNALTSLGAWEVTEGNPASFLPAPIPFSRGQAGFVYQDHSPTKVFSVRCAGMFDAPDEGFGFEAFVPEPAELNKYPVFKAQWGLVGSKQAYQVKIVDGRASVVRLAPTWTQERETALEELLSEDERPTEVDTAIEAEKPNLYADEWSLDFGGTLYNQPLTVLVVPDEAKFHVFLNGKRTTIDAPVPRGYSASAPRLWAHAPCALRSNGGAFVVRPGYPWFLPETTMRLDESFGTDPMGTGGSSDTLRDVVAYLPAGTSVTITPAYFTESGTTDVVSVEWTLTLTTTNRRVAPVVYHLSLLLKGGARNGAMEVSWDSGALTGSAFAPDEPDPILEIVPNSEGEGQPRQFTVTLRDLKGRTFREAGFHYSILENKVVTLKIDGQNALTEGLCVAGRWLEIGDFVPNMPHEQVTRAETIAELTLVDAVQIMAERRCRGEIGNGYGDGAFLKVLLANCGQKDWQLQYIPDTIRRTLPPATAAKGFDIRANVGQFYRSYIWDTYLPEWLPGYFCYQDTGGHWRVVERSNTAIATFTASAAPYNANTYPDRYRILQTLNATRETSRFYNVHTAEWEDADGNPQSAEWVIYESIRQGSSIPSKKFIGREIEAAPLQFKDEDSANEGLRRTVARQGDPRSVDFQSYFHTTGCGGLDFVPGNTINAGGLVGHITRVTGSYAEDLSTICVEEF